MSDEMSKGEQLLMWGLFAAGGARLLKDIVPKPAGGAHEALARRGFIANPKHERTRRLELTDKGWRWIGDGEPFPIAEGEGRVTAERRLLQALTRSVKRNAAAQGVALSELFRAEAPAPAEGKPETEPKSRADASAAEAAKGRAANGKAAKGRATKDKATKDKATAGKAAGAAAVDATSPEPPRDLAAEIRDACRDLAGHPQRDGVRFSALRARLGHVGRADLDAALLAMRDARQANLMNLDNPRDIAAEKGAELRAGSQVFHLVWIEA